jgi:hypothetical protein
MAGVVHSFSNPKADGVDTTVVRPSDWNDEHVYSGGNLGALLYVGASDVILALNSSIGIPYFSGTAAVPTVLTLGSGLSVAGGALTASGAVAGSDTQVQFNDAGAMAGDAGLTYNKTTDTLTAGIFSGSGASLTSIPFSALSDNANIARLDQAETVASAWTFSSQIKAADGTAAAPGIAFAAQADFGWFRAGSYAMATGIAGGAQHAVRNSEGFIVNTGNGFGWVSSSNAGTGTIDTRLARAAAGICAVTSAFQFTETTDFAAPAATKATLYARQTGGKTELVVRFATGTIQQVAIEP